MTKFQVFRADINKVVAKEVAADDAAHALGQYASVLMAAGIIAMRAAATEMLSDNTMRINKLSGVSFIVEARAL